MNFNKFSVSAKAASPLMPWGKDTAEYTIYGEQKFTETVWIKCAASLTAHFSSIKCNNYEGQWSFGSGVFNLSYLLSIISRLITVSTCSCVNPSLTFQSMIQMPTIGCKNQNTALEPTVTFSLIDRYFNRGSNTITSVVCCVWCCLRFESVMQC